MSSILLAIFVQALSIGARAEVQVTGEPDAIQVEAKEASVEELLTALRKAYGLRVLVFGKSQPFRLGNLCRIASAGGLARADAARL